MNLLIMKLIWMKMDWILMIILMNMVMNKWLHCPIAIWINDCAVLFDQLVMHQMWIGNQHTVHLVDLGTSFLFPINYVREIPPNITYWNNTLWYNLSPVIFNCFLSLCKYLSSLHRPSVLSSPQNFWYNLNLFSWFRRCGGPLPVKKSGGIVMMQCTNRQCGQKVSSGPDRTGISSPTE